MKKGIYKSKNQLIISSAHHLISSSPHRLISSSAHLLILMLISSSLFSQSPQKMSYQAVIRDAGSALVTSHAVGMRISILQGSSSGTVVYTETQTPGTNTNGLVSIEIGGGTGFDAIDWSSGPYFLKTETDPTGGTNYSISGTSQLLSVPYALYSKKAASYTETDPVFSAAPSYGISGSNITNWNTAYGWGNHAGLYRSNSWVPAWTDVTAKPTFATVATSGSYNDLSNKPTILNSQWTTSGSNIYYNSGNVGIGTLSPNSLINPYMTIGDALNSNAEIMDLTIKPTGNTDYLRFYGIRKVAGTNWSDVALRIQQRVDGTDMAYVEFNPSTSGYDLAFGTNNIERLRISQSGNVGIGTVSPGYKLDIVGRSRIQSGGGDAGLWLMDNTNALNRSFVGMYGNDHVGFYGTGGANWGMVMNVNNGNVGIGTTTPAYKLDVAGYARISTSEVGDGIEMSLYGTGNRYSGIDFHGDDTYSDFGLRIIRWNGGPDTESHIIHRGTGAFMFETYENAPLTFTTTSLERMRITEDGKIGINTSTPTSKVHIQIAGTAGQIVINPTINSNAFLKLSNPNNGTAMLFDYQHIESVAGTLYLNRNSSQPVCLGGGGGGVQIGNFGSQMSEIKLVTGTLPAGVDKGSHWTYTFSLPNQSDWDLTKWTVISCELLWVYCYGPGENTLGGCGFRYYYNHDNFYIDSAFNLSGTQYKIVIMRFN
jgi:hypothetical protein